MGVSDYLTQYDARADGMELQENLGTGQFVTIQTDFINPLSENIKIEGGLRASLRKNTSENAA